MIGSLSQFDPGEIIEGMLAGTIWSPRFPLRRAERLAQLDPEDDPLPARSGICRVHIEGQTVLGHLGHTGNLRRRANELSTGVYGEEMPYTTPHVAAPSLWAWVRSPPYAPLSISFALVEASAWWRAGLRDLAIALERWQRKRSIGSSGEHTGPSAFSPLANFGKAPHGWRLSSSRRKGDRGGPTMIEDASHEPSLAPLGDLDDQQDACADTWGMHSWSSWRYVREVPRGTREKGLYRLRLPDAPELFYLGYGLFGEAARTIARANPCLLFSAASGDWTPHGQAELLTDLLGLYLLQRRTLPCAQYGGQERCSARELWRGARAGER